ncbi:DsrE family protein [Candidatus Fermentibacterales bacterium]|nr:DsrE family protein [Candidatus Fermentibacterales bacterium]
MKVSISVNDAPYGTEKAYNALRMAMAIRKQDAQVEVRVFLLADGVFCGLPGQKTPHGYYNTERMLRSVIRRGGEVRACGLCSEARGTGTLELIEGIQPSNMMEFAQWTLECEKAITF